MWRCVSRAGHFHAAGGKTVVYLTAGLLRDLTMKSENDEIPQKKKRLRFFREISIILAAGVGLYLISAEYDFLEKIVEFSQRNKGSQVDELIVVAIYLMFAFLVISVRYWRGIAVADRELKKKAEDLQKALGEIKQLKGIIPICSSCKKIRDDQGFWHQVESYLQSRSDAEFSHGICPDCMKKLYPNLGKKKEAGAGNPDSGKSLPQ